MKYVTALIGGIVLGAVAALAALYVNPFTAPRPPELGDFGWVLRYDFPLDDVLLFTHGGHLALPAKPEGVPSLWESTIESAAVGVVALTGEDDKPAAVASRLTVPSERTDLLTSGVILNDYWLLSVPGQGSLFVVADSNVWPIVKENVLPVSLLGRPWAGPRSYLPTDGPGLRGTALVLGATGGFADREGSAIERFRLTRFSRSKGLEHVATEMHLRLVEALPISEAVPASEAPPPSDTAPTGEVPPDRLTASETATASEP